jgi:hypothetical protein
VASLTGLIEGPECILKAILLNLEGFRSLFINQIEFGSESVEGVWPPSSAPPPGRRHGIGRLAGNEKTPSQINL